jgi:hypothetical protein
MLASVCEGKLPSWPSDVLASMRLPKRAEDIRYEQFGGTYQVFFNAHACYPARETIEDMAAAMSSLGWKRLTDDPLNPGRPLSHTLHPNGLGWMHVIDTKDGVVHHYFGWLDYWEDSQGNMLQYRFTLRNNTGDIEEACDLGGFIDYIPKAVWEHMKGSN